MREGSLTERTAGDMPVRIREADGMRGHMLKGLGLLLSGLLALAGAEGGDRTEEAAIGGSPPATYGPWHSCKIGGGGYIQNVVLCPSNPQRAYAYVDVGGVYRSDDGGRRWRMMHGGLPTLPTAHNVRGLLVDPRDDARLIAAVGDPWVAHGVFVSTDAGATWRHTLAAPFFGNGPYRWAGMVLARRPDDPDVVLAATVHLGVWRSADNGETWKQCGAEGLYPSDIRFDRTHPDRVWLCAQEHEEWWRGERRRWPPGLYRSDDGGGTWEKIADRAPSELLQDPVDPAVLYGLFDGAMHMSRDLGATWAAFGEGLPARSSGGYASEDEFQSLAAGPDFVLTASTKGTFYRLRSGARAWTKIEREGIEEVYEGEEWFRHRQGSFGSALCSIVIDPRDEGHWFFTDWFAIYQTPDAGKHWALTLDGLEDTVLHVLQQDPREAQVVHLGMADNGYFRSENGGERFGQVGWQDGITNNVKCISLSPVRPERVYAVSCTTWEWESNQVFISDDGGRRWRRSPMTGLPDMAEHHCNTIAVHPAQPDTVYLAVSLAVGEKGGGVYRSGDGGESWEWMGEGLPEGEEFFAHSIWGVGREIAVWPDGSLVCVGRAGSKVYRRGPAEAGWRAADTELGRNPNSVVADPHRPGRFFLAAGGVFRSDDFGRTWGRVLEGDVQHVAVDLARPGRVAAGTADGVALSQDGGESWRVLDRRLPNRRHNLVAFAGDRVIAGSGGSGAFWLELSAE